MKRRIAAWLLAALLAALCVLPALGDSGGCLILGDGVLAPNGSANFATLFAEAVGTAPTNLARPGTDTAGLLDLVRDDRAYRSAAAGADRIVISVGGQDLLAAARTLLGAEESATLGDLVLSAAASEVDSVGDILTNLTTLSRTLVSEKGLAILEEAAARAGESFALLLDELEALNPTVVPVVILPCNPFTGTELADHDIPLERAVNYWIHALEEAFEACDPTGDRFVAVLPTGVTTTTVVDLSVLMEQPETLPSRAARDPDSLSDCLRLSVQPDEAGAEELVRLTAQALRDAQLRAADRTELPFDDVPEELEDAVRRVYAMGLMQGVAEDTFDPEGTLTRAMTVTVLYRLAGSPDPETAGSFSDVAPEAWYAPAVEWAAAEGIVLGSGDGTFDPESAVTGQQLAALIYRYAASRGMDMSVGADARALVDALTEFGTLDAWAADCVGWALTRGMMDLERLRPNEPATRADTALCLAALLADGNS